ncbi:hypothetical protein [Nocardioides sp. SYSU DS0663]|uniref:hypothetical protein n=1 Tax=Nocardioides sp. SYSU DS0663 TaxID=3416445 RepID=UPI003F4BBBBB
MSPSLLQKSASSAAALAAMLVLALCVGLAAGAGTATAAPTGTGADAAAEPAAAKKAAEPLRKKRCTKWKAHGGIGWRNCAKLYSIKDKVRIDYRARFHNESATVPENATCEHSKTTTWQFGTSVTVETEARAIFAKLKGSVTGSVSYSTSTTETSGISFKVPPKAYAYCERGFHGYTFRGLVWKETCDRGTKPATCTRSGDRSFKGSAPEANFWRHGDGRGGAPKTP